MRSKYIEANVPEGIKVVVSYFKEGQWMTKCHLVDEESGTVLVTASSHCSPKDQPNRKIGRAIAVGRALRICHMGN